MNVSICTPHFPRGRSLQNGENETGLTVIASEAKQSSPAMTHKDWIASSLALLAMTGGMRWQVRRRRKKYHRDRLHGTYAAFCAPFGRMPRMWLMAKTRSARFMV